MNDFRALLRSLITFAIALPMAIVIGYMLAQDLSYTSLSIIGMSIGFLTLPLVFKWHHPLLLLSWNMSAIVFLLPGQPQVWLLMAIISAGFALMQRALNKESGFLHAPSVTLPLIFLALVVFITAFLTGGLGMKSLGSGSAGGRRYFMIIAAIVGYFAITSRQIPRERVWIYVGLFFLGGLTNLMADAYPFVPSSLQFLFWVFPVQKGTLGASGSDFVGNFIGRYYGVTMGCLAICFYLMARTGLRAMLEGRKVWHLALFLTAAVMSLLGGYRSLFILLVLTFFFVFYLEGLMRSRYLPMFTASLVLVFAAIIPFGDKLPMAMQRAISVLPWVEVSPVARWDAKASTEWRLAIWNELIPQVPDYLFLGKGYAISVNDMSLTRELAQSSTLKSAEMANLAGDYHNGPLSVLIPFGIWGAAGFIWFLFGAWRALLSNYRYGDPELRQVNGLLLALFCARVVLFCTIFGGFYGDMMHFAGLVGLSISINGGIKRPVRAPAPAEVRIRMRVPVGPAVVGHGAPGVRA
jgi:hypothetical protein